MKRLFGTIIGMLITVGALAGTSCKVEGSSNNNIAVLKDSYVRSWQAGGKCKIRSFVELIQPSLGTTTVIIEVLDEYNRNVGNEVRLIYKGEKSTGVIEFEVNKSDEPCGYYNLSISAATCVEENSNKPLNQPIVTSSETYVDLGLPSGTIWKNTNEVGEFASRNEVLLKYDSSLPTPEQWQELINYCTWEWENCGVKITSQNGKSIFLPARQEYNKYKNDYDCLDTYYHTSSFDKKRWLFFSDNNVELEDKAVYFSIGKVQDFIRLVKTNKTESSYVDLGLASGTKWKSHDENEFLSYEEATSKYKKQIPTHFQWKELIEDCTWEDVGVKYIVTGPNGKSIQINKAGVCTGKNKPESIGIEACYWTSSVYQNNPPYFNYLYSAFKTYPARGQEEQLGFTNFYTPTGQDCSIHLVESK